MKEVAVIGGSSNSHLEAQEIAFEIGRLLANRGILPLTCGINFGLIAKTLDPLAPLGLNCRAIVIKDSDEENNTHPSVGTVVFVESAAERKLYFLQNFDIIVALPGGLGTHDEIFSFLTESKAGNWAGKIILVNFNGFFDPLMHLLNHLVNSGTLKGKHLRNLILCSDSAEVMRELLGA